jgi:DNA-binding transcriptional LysR family regulator
MTSSTIDRTPDPTFPESVPFPGSAASAASLRGVVRISATETVGVEVLPSILADFRHRHPGIVVELALATYDEDVPRRSADIAIRMTRPTRDGLVATHAGPVTLGLFAHRRYADSQGLPSRLEELVGHSIIGFDRNEETIRVMGSLGLDLTRQAFAARTHSRPIQLALLRAGFGIGICQWGIARRDGDLLPVLPDLVSSTQDLWIATHEDAYGDDRVRLVVDHLVAELGVYAETCRP